MARIIERMAKNGARSWLVKWRIDGGRGGREDFETCYERQIAEDFAALVELSGENRPHGYPKGCHGIEDPHFDGTLDADMPTFEQYERHAVDAPAAEAAIRQVAVKRWIGLSATPYRADEMDALITM